jgi:predicted ArsR family transcriptional regulator
MSSDEMPRSVSVSDEQILSALEEERDDGCPVHTVPDLAEQLPLGQDGIRKRLKKLEKREVVKSRDVGARAVVWWRELN